MASPLTTLARSSSLRLGLLEGCQQDEFLDPAELSHLHSASNEELTTPSSSSARMVKRGVLIPAPKDPPPSPKRRPGHGPWSTNNFDNPTPALSRIGRIPKISQQPQTVPIKRREPVTNLKIFQTAVGDISGPNPPSTSKSPRNIRGLAQKNDTQELIQVKGKAKAKDSRNHIDLTNDSDGEHPIDKAFNPLKKRIQPHSHHDSANEESDDPMSISRKPKPKRVDKMEGKQRPSATKSLTQPSNNDQKDTTISKSPFVGKTVELARVEFDDNHGTLLSFDFSVDPSCHVHFEVPDNKPPELVLKARRLKHPGPPSFHPLKFTCNHIQKISVHAQSQLVLHLDNHVELEAHMDNDFWASSATYRQPVPTGSPIHNILVLEVMHSNKEKYDEILGAILDDLETHRPNLKKEQHEDPWQIFLAAKDPYPDSDLKDDFPSKKAKAKKTSPTPINIPTNAPVEYIACTASTSTLPTLGNSSRNGVQISTAVYKTGNRDRSNSKSQPTSQPSDITTKAMEKEMQVANIFSLKPPKKAKPPPVEPTLSARYNTRSTLQQSIQSPRRPPSDHPPATSAHALDSDIVLIWPFEDDRYTSSVAITNGDMKRLADGEFLNDTLIEFGLKWELSEIQKKNPALVASIHLFNSFFFQKLSSFKARPKFSVSEDAKEAYAGVRKWTKGLDVFKKNFLVIPINEHMHWYFIIVSNPGKLLDPQIQKIQNPAPISHPSPVLTMRTRQSQKFQLMENNSTVKITTQEPPAEPKTSIYFDKVDERDMLPPDEKTDAKVEVNNLNINSAVDKSTQVLEHMNLDDQKAQDGIPSEEFSIDKTELPYVLTLDSLGSSHRPQSQTILRYLINEADDKLKQTLPETLLKSVNVRKVTVPEQPNYCDCGLYLIHAFKTFFSKPDALLKWILDNPKGRPTSHWSTENQELWDATGAAQARQTLRTQIQALIPLYQEKVKLRKAAAEEKKLEQTKIRKLSCCTDTPNTPSNPETSSTKKPRITAPDPTELVLPSICSASFITDHISHIPTPPSHPPESSSLSRKSNRFLEGSTKSKAENDEMYAKFMMESQKQKPKNASRIESSPLSTINGTSDMESMKPVVIESPKSSPKEVEVGRRFRSPVTPDEDLMLAPNVLLREIEQILPYNLSGPSSSQPVQSVTVVSVGKQKMEPMIIDEIEQSPRLVGRRSIDVIESANYDGEPMDEDGDWNQESRNTDSSSEIVIHHQNEKTSNHSQRNDLDDNTVRAHQPYSDRFYGSRGSSTKRRGSGPKQKLSLYSTFHSINTKDNNNNHNHNSNNNYNHNNSNNNNHKNSKSFLMSATNGTPVTKNSRHWAHGAKQTFQPTINSFRNNSISSSSTETNTHVHNTNRKNHLHHYSSHNNHSDNNNNNHHHHRKNHHNHHQNNHHHQTNLTHHFTVGGSGSGVNTSSNSNSDKNGIREAGNSKKSITNTNSTNTNFVPQPIDSPPLQLDGGDATNPVMIL